MKNINPYKYVNVFFFLATISVIFIIKYYVGNGYCVDFCSYEFKNGFIDPVYVATPILISILAVFVLLPSHYFRRWLWYVASWAFPVLLYFVASESVYSSNFLSGRKFIAEMGMYIIAIISFLFVVGVFAFGQYKKYFRK